MTRADLVRDGLSVGMTPSEIISEYDLNPQYVYVTAWRLRNPGRVREYEKRDPRKGAFVPRETWGKPWDDESEVETVIKLRERGYSMGMIGRKLGRPRNSICGFVHRLRARGINVA